VSLFWTHSWPPPQAEDHALLVADLFDFSPPRGWYFIPPCLFFSWITGNFLGEVCFSFSPASLGLFLSFWLWALGRCHFGFSLFSFIFSLLVGLTKTSSPWIFSMYITTIDRFCHEFICHFGHHKPGALTPFIFLDRVFLLFFFFTAGVRNPEFFCP